MKRLLILAVVFSVLLSLGTVSLVSGTGGEPTPPPTEPPPGTITVKKVDADTGAPIKGWEIRIYSTPYQTQLASLTTGSDGTVTFTLPDSYVWYYVWEEDSVCYEPIFPDGVYVKVFDGGRAVLERLDPSEQVSIEFSNHYTCEGFEACTPGYWKNKHRIAAYPDGPWPLDPSDDFDVTFGVDLFDPDITLEEAIKMRGGGVGRLARHGTAALLTAAHPDVNYPLDVAGVIAAVQGGQADLLADYNEELDCPLN